MSQPPTRTPAKTNYLNNRDILKEIHLSKNSYCTFRDPVTDHQYDIILPTLGRINQKTVAEARRNRADRIRRETGVELDPRKIPNTDLVFRIMTWEHIPLAPKKVAKAPVKKRKIQDILDLDVPEEDPLADLVEEPVLDPAHMRVNFPPFHHYRIDQNREPYLVGKSHWRGDLLQGEFCKDHGKMTNKLALMFIKLCERYATRSNWRGYCVDTKTEALTQRGWLKHDQISKNDLILSYDGQHNQWSKIFSIYQAEYNGLMHKLDSRGMDALVTPGHKFVTANGLVKAEHILHSDRIVLMGQAVPVVEKTHDDALVELAGWIVTKGDYQSEKGSVSIYQNKGTSADSVRRCLHALEYQFSERTDPKNNVQFLVNKVDSSVLMDLLPEQNLTMDFICKLTPDQQQLLLDTMINGDGWTRGRRASSTQKNPAGVDMFQALCAVAGRKTNAHFRANKISFGKATSWYDVNLFTRNTTNGSCIEFHGGRTSNKGAIGRGKQHHPNQPTVHYHGTVWCPETEYGNFVARRNGKVYLTGNTYNEEMRGQALLQLSQIGLQFDESKSQNPFAYYTAAITNSFTRILNLEKKNQNIRDDILEMNGLNPSWTRQNSGKSSPGMISMPVVGSYEE